MNSLMKRIAALDDEAALATLLVPFFVVFTVCAIVFQATSGEAPNTPATVVDQFSSGLLWVGSVVALLIAAHNRRSTRYFLGWLVVSAGAGALAIDEVVELHERTLQTFGEDDYSKILIWVAAVAAVAIILRFERAWTYFTIPLVVGLVLHTAYLLTDLGDGEFFQVPLSESAGYWTEEILEILALQAYISALLFHLTTIKKAAATPVNPIPDRSD